MSVRETYERWTKMTDPNYDPVKEEIRKGLRQPDGLSDIHHHLPHLRFIACGNVLEIGVRFGASTTALLLGLDEKCEGHLWSVDTEDCSGVAIGHPHWTFLRLNSVTNAEQIKSIIPSELELLFIDGEHTYETVYADLFNYAPRAKTVALHDANFNENPGVLAAIFEWLNMPGCRHQHVVVYPRSHGLAVLS